MKVRHIASRNLWLLTQGSRVLYQGRISPWESKQVLEHALRRCAPVAASTLNSVHLLLREPRAENLDSTTMKTGG